MNINKGVSLFVIFLLMLIPIVPVGANQAGQSNSRSGVTSAQVEPVQVQSQLETQIANQGEEAQLQVMADYSVEMMAQKMSQVRLRVSSTSEHGKEIHGELSDQAQRQEQLKLAQAKLDNRTGIWRMILGPDYRALKTLGNVIGENKFQIQTLKEYQGRPMNQAEEVSVRELISALEAENKVLQTRIDSENNHPGILGWLFKLFD